MFVEGLGEIKAVGFDIDGTLYRPYHLHARMAMHFFRYNQFFLKYGRTRHVMHGMERQKDFSKKQAEILSKKIGCTVEDCEERLSRIVYDGLAKFFPSIPSCKYVKETFQVFYEAGLKIALLSDFPPEQKGELWGIKPYCHVMLGSEEIGALKPDPYPFFVMAEKLKVKPEEILYVGNSVKYDVRGAKNAGMKSAFLEPLWRTLLHMPCKEADISFSNYRQLQKIVLQYKI